MTFSPKVAELLREAIDGRHDYDEDDFSRGLYEGRAELAERLLALDSPPG